MRQLLTEGEIRYATVQNTEAGLRSEILTPVTGPCGIIMTTTEVKLHPEDENRFLSFTVENSADHLLDVLIAKASEKQSVPCANELSIFHEYYNLLRQNTPSVEIPFAEQIVKNLPRDHLRVIRDFEKVQSLIKTVALLHRFEREKTEQGSVLAAFEDYEIVRDLLEDMLAQGWGVSTAPGVRLVVEAVKQLTTGRAYSVSQKEIARHLQADPATVSRNVRTAVDEELLIDQNPGQGKTAAISLGTGRSLDGIVLPTTESLR